MLLVVEGFLRPKEASLAEMNFWIVALQTGMLMQGRKEVAQM